MEKQVDKISTKITKVTLVIYFSFVLVSFIACLVPSIVLKDWTITYGYLVCLAPGLLFAMISIFLPIDKFFATKSKKMIALYCVLYIVKYLLIFIVPLLCLFYAEETMFNRWSMMASTLIAPLVIIFTKLIIAIVDSKKSKKDTKTTTNSIKF